MAYEGCFWRGTDLFWNKLKVCKLLQGREIIKFNPLFDSPSFVLHNFKKWWIHKSNNKSMKGRCSYWKLLSQKIYENLQVQLKKAECTHMLLSLNYPWTEKCTHTPSVFKMCSQAVENKASQVLSTKEHFSLYKWLLCWEQKKVFFFGSCQTKWTHLKSRNSENNSESVYKKTTYLSQS